MNQATQHLATTAQHTRTTWAVVVVLAALAATTSPASASGGGLHTKTIDDLRYASSPFEVVTPEWKWQLMQRSTRW